jgi:hypothetical protein
MGRVLLSIGAIIVAVLVFAGQQAIREAIQYIIGILVVAVLAALGFKGTSA